MIRFDMLVSLLFDVAITNLYLKLGHSHIRADRIVALSKAKLRGMNFYTLPAIVTAMNKAKTLTAELVTDIFYTRQPLLEKHFPRLPAGSSRAFYFEMHNLVVKMYSTAAATAPTKTFPFRSSLTAKNLRRGVLKDLLGLQDDVHPKTMVTTQLLLARTAKIELSVTKVKNIWDDVRDKVPPEALDYFPRPAEEENNNVASQASQGSQASCASQAMPPPKGRSRPGPKPKPRPVDRGSRSIAVMFQRLHGANSW